MLGISVYFQDLNEDYLRYVAKCQAKYIMTSLQIPEEDYSHLDEQLPHFFDLLQELDMELIPDVSEETFRKLNLEVGNFKALKEKGFQKVRLDYGFDDIETLKAILEDFDVVLNASIVDEKKLIELQEAQVDMSKISAMHNFYPRKDTGLKEEEFLKKNELLHRYGVKIQAFVCGDDLKRFPLYEGLPTLEKHRQVHPLVATIDLMKNYHVDDVFVGDSRALKSTILAMSAYINQKTLLLPTYLSESYQHYYDQTFHCRKELSPDIVRITTPRVKDIAPYHNQYRYKGSICIDNELMGRYCGEMQLMKKDMPMDARCNVIGMIYPEYQDVLDFIDSSLNIKFVKF